MAEAIVMKVERRTATGKGPARQMRMKGFIPAVIYGHGRETESLSIPAAEFEKVLKGVSAETVVFDLAIGDTVVKTLIRDVQRHPFKSKILHVDFYEIHAGEKLKVHVPIHLVGAAAGVRAGGVMDQVLRDIEVEVLPRHIPEHIDVDVNALAIGGSLHVSDLVVENATILTDPSKTICTVLTPRVEVEEAVVAEEAEEEVAEPELIRKPKEEAEEAEGGEE